MRKLSCLQRINNIYNRICNGKQATKHIVTITAPSLQKVWTNSLKIELKIVQSRYVTKEQYQIFSKMVIYLKKKLSQCYCFSFHVNSAKKLREKKLNKKKQKQNKALSPMANLKRRVKTVLLCTALLHFCVKTLQV